MLAITRAAPMEGSQQLVCVPDQGEVVDRRPSDVWDLVSRACFLKGEMPGEIPDKLE